jgi:hypothetical protein
MRTTIFAALAVMGLLLATAAMAHAAQTNIFQNNSVSDGTNG